MSSPVQSVLWLFDKKPLLATYDHDATRNKPLRPRRILRVSSYAVACLCILSTMIFWNHEFFKSYIMSTTTSNDSLPPLYSAYHLQELALPQHNPELPYPEGKTGKYVWFSGHVRGVGWGNVLQEQMLNALVAYDSNRSFVFNNYTWSLDDTSLYSSFNGKLIPARIPMTALISGPLAGGPFSSEDDTPRSVLRDYFYDVCPVVKYFNGGEARAILPDEPSVLSLANTWVKLLDETEENCVEIGGRPFDSVCEADSCPRRELRMFGSDRLLDIFPSLFASPMVKLFRWSPLIESAFHENLPTILAGQNLTLEAPSADDPYPKIPGLLVLHLRRGDYKEYCKNLAEWGSTWSGLNQIEGLEQRRPTEEQILAGQYEEAFAKTCYPTTPQIVQKVHEARADTPGLKRVFIMTNGPSEWIAELKEALRKDAEWDTLVSSRDLKLNLEQTYVKQTVDMLIGQRADVFIDNGFSSLTGNIVMLRMSKSIGHPRTRFW